MILSDVVAIALSIVGFLASLQGLWLVCRALWPAAVEAAAGRCERNRVASFFVGLPLTGLILVLAGVLSKAPGAPARLLAVVILFFYVMFAGIGMAGLATHIGRRLESPSDMGRPWRSTVRGGVALELAWLIPVLGWVGLLPMSFILGFGAVAISIFKRSDVTRGTFPAPVLPDLAPQPTRRPSGAGSVEMPSLHAEGVLP